MEYIIGIVIGLVVGAVIAYILSNSKLNKKVQNRLEEAEAQAEAIKRDKLLEVKEKFLNKKAELEKEVQQRDQKLQQNENRLRQKEMQLNQRHEDLQRKHQEADAVRENLENQMSIIDDKKEELEKLQMQEREKLEVISGLSAEEAKGRLIESLKEEAKTEAASYINDIIDDAKMTASKEAKKIVIQTIQRIGTETAIENSVTLASSSAYFGSPVSARSFSTRRIPIWTRGFRTVRASMRRFPRFRASAR